MNPAPLFIYSFIDKDSCSREDVMLTSSHAAVKERHEGFLVTRVLSNSSYSAPEVDMVTQKDDMFQERHVLCLP